MDADVKTIIDGLGSAFEEFKVTHAREVAELKTGAADVVTTDKLARIDEALNKLSEANEAIGRRADAIEKRAGRPGIGHNGGPSLEDEVKSFMVAARAHAAAAGRASPADISEEGYKAYKAGFNLFVRGGDRHFGDEQRKALSVGTDPDGGYLVPADMSGRIVMRVFETSPMRAVASVQTISTDALDGIRDTDEAASGGWVSETATRAETATPQIGTWSIPVHEMYAEPRATQRLLDDAAVDVEAWLAMKVADRLTRFENAAFITGDGVGKPRGIAAYPTAATADDSRAWGTFEHINTGVSSAFAASNPADILFDLIGAMKDAYTANARWMTRRQVITLIRKFKDTAGGTYLWQPGLQQGQPQTILGFPVSIAQDMPALASGSLSLAFGDFREAYQVVDRQGFRTLRDPYTAKPFVKFYTTRRVGGGAIQFEAVKFVRFGT
jgi:HK97 family phage major capsid protein